MEETTDDKCEIGEIELQPADKDGKCVECETLRVQPINGNPHDISFTCGANGRNVEFFVDDGLKPVDCPYNALDRRYASLAKLRKQFTDETGNPLLFMDYIGTKTSDYINWLENTILGMKE